MYYVKLLSKCILLTPSLIVKCFQEELHNFGDYQAVYKYTTEGRWGSQNKSYLPPFLQNKK